MTVLNLRKKLIFYENDRLYKRVLTKQAIETPKQKCQFGDKSLRDCMHFRKCVQCSFGIVSIQDRVNLGSCP